MLVGPIVLRELTVALHQEGLVKARMRIAMGASVVTAILMLLAWLGLPLLKWSGTLLYMVLAAMALLLPARLGLGLILDERSSGTLDLLFLAGVRPLDFLLSKTVGALLITSNFLLGLTPFLALPFLAGGLSFETFLGMLMSLPVLLLSSAGLTLLVSTIARNDAAAFALLLTTGGTWAAGLPVVYWMGRLVTGTPTFSEAWLGLTPLYSPVLLIDGLNPTTAALFWPALGGLLAISLGMFVVAASLLPSVWRREQESHRNDISTRIAISGPAVWGENPIKTRIVRNRQCLRLPYALLAGFVGCWIAGMLLWGKPWMASSLALAAMFLLAIVSNSLTGFLLIPHVARSRREGAFLDLLLTPLNPTQIVDGWVEGYAELVDPWRRVVAMVSAGLFVVALFSRSWSGGALISYLIIGGLLLRWTTESDNRDFARFRVAYFTGNPVLAHLRSSGVWGWIVVFQGINFYRVFQGLRSMGRPPEFPTGSALELTFVILGVLFIGGLIWAKSRTHENVIRRLAIEELRGLALEPLPSRQDPRLKRWKPDQPLLDAPE